MYNEPRTKTLTVHYAGNYVPSEDAAYDDHNPMKTPVIFRLAARDPWSYGYYIEGAGAFSMIDDSEAFPLDEVLEWAFLLP